MSQSISQLEKAVLDRLLAAARAPAGPAGETPEASDYDWSVPHHFTQTQWRRVNEFAAVAVEKASAALAAMLGDAIELKVEAVTQHFGAHLMESDAEKANFVAEILDDSGETCGLMVLPPSCAIGWVIKLLGGSQGEQDRQLSASETVLLGDVFSSLTKAFSAASQAAGGGKLAAGPQADKGQFRLPGRASEEFARIDFRPADAPETEATSCILLCGALEALAGTDGGGAGGKKPADARAAMLAHIELAPVVVTVRLGDIRATVGEIAALEPGDVLLTSTGPDLSVNVLVEDRRVFSGMLATSAGRYAVRIAAPAGTHDDLRASSTEDQERNPTDG